MIRRVLAFLLAALPAAGAGVAGWQRKQNVVLVDLAGPGRAELEWLNASTFRFERCRTKTCAGREGLPDPAEFTVREAPAALVFETEHLEVQVRKADATITARSRRAGVLLDELPASGGGALFERRSPAAERLYGLGPRTDAELNLRGKLVNSSVPLLISSLGYGQYFTATGAVQFDLARTVNDRVRVVGTPPGADLEFYFYYGPTPKEILEEHAAVVPVSISPHPATVGILAAPPRHAHRVPPLTDALQLAAYLSHAAMSGILTPAVALDAAPVAPFVQLSPLVWRGAAPLRTPLEPYLYTYLVEARDRSLPMVHPMALQFPNDPECARHAAQFFLGDELLVTPSEQAYLPAGIWTHMATGALFKGRQTITVPKSAGLPLFARNGSIVPWRRPSDGVMELHYFPRLGAEFFIAEPGDDMPSQVHAGPAGDWLRLEIESRVERRYEWVVHHVSKPAGATPEGARYDDALRQLRVPVAATKMGDSIVNISLVDPL